MSLRIVVADDHRVVRQGLKSLLEKESDFEVVAEASDGRSTVAKVNELRPDVVIMDVAMPSLNGVEATRQILRENPQVRILALSMHSDPRLIARMLRAGATGYVLKECDLDEIVRAVRSVAEGRTFLGPRVAAALVDDYLKQTHSGEPAMERVLSPREREVLQLLAEGKSTKDIADLLSVSIKTVETHRKQIMDKLDLHSVAELTKYAIREGLTTLE